MVTKVILPKLEANMEEGRIVKWLKKEGDKIKKGEPLFVLETLKAVFDVEAEASGTLLKIIAKEGSNVPVTSVIAVIGEEGEEIPDELNK